MQFLSFDLWTAIVLAVLISVIMGAAFLILARLQISGFTARQWGWGMLTLAVGSALLLVRGEGVPLWPLFLANILLHGGVLWFVWALLIYLKRPVNPWAIALTLAGLIAYYLYAFYGDEDMRLRGMATGFFLSAMGLIAARALWRDTEPYRSKVSRVAAIPFILMVVGYGPKGVYFLVELLFLDQPLIPVSVFFSLTFLSIPVMIVATGLGYFSLVLADTFHAARRSQTWAQSAVHSSPTAIVLTDAASHDVIEINDAFQRMFGVTAEEAIGRPVDDLGLFDPEFLTAYRQLLNRGGQRTGATGRYRRPDGRSGVFKSSGDRIDLDGDICFLTFVWDITDEAHLADVLRREKEVAEDEARVKSRFLAMMSHDFRTPLSAAMGLAELMRHEERSATDHRRLDGILQSTATLARMVDDILDLSRLEEGGLHLTDASFDPAALAERLEAICGPSASAKGLDFLIELDPDLPPALRGDQHRLGQVVINLLHNAIKFTERGAVTLAIGQEGAAGDDAARLVVEVRDSGPGLTSEERDTLFEAFRQGEVAKGRGGAGLGLAICREIVDLMAGSITVTTNQEGGATFRVALPLVVADPDDLAPERLTAVTGAWAGQRVLLTEDTDLNREVMIEQLRREGAEVVAVSEGASAALFALVAEPAFDIVLLDIQMPVLSGVEVARLIRSRPRGQSVLLAALTAYSEDIDRAACQAAGIDAFFSKPPDLEAMAAILTPPAEAAGGREAPSRPGFDIVAAAKGWGDDAAPLGVLLSRFATAYAAFDGQLTDDWRAGRHEDVLTTVHRLKGMAALMHAASLRDVAAEAENRLGAATPEEAADVLVRLEQSVSTHVDLIKAGLAQVGTAPPLATS